MFADNEVDSYKSYGGCDEKYYRKCAGHCLSVNISHEQVTESCNCAERPENGQSNAYSLFCYNFPVTKMQADSEEAIKTDRGNDEEWNASKKSSYNQKSNLGFALRVIRRSRITSEHLKYHGDVQGLYD